jgi:hypothetical protein
MAAPSAVVNNNSHKLIDGQKASWFDAVALRASRAILLLLLFVL